MQFLLSRVGRIALLVLGAGAGKPLKSDAETLYLHPPKSSFLAPYQKDRLRHLVNRDADTNICEMDSFDFHAPAELFHPLKMGKRSPLTFHRFDTCAEAVKFAVEQLSPHPLQGAVLEVAEARLDSNEIRELYDSGDFPLARKS